MSVAGVYSNIGDGYQTLIAFGWALRVLSNPDYIWLQVDSVEHSVEHSVDDVVISRADGSLIACQCKKNQTDFKSWSVSDLDEEIDKAVSFLVKYPTSEVLFYSRSNFGDLAKLREFGLTQPDGKTFLANLSNKLKAVNSALEARFRLVGQSFSTYEFIRRTDFVASETLALMKDDLIDRLQQIASNPKIAYNALWTSLDELGGRLHGNVGSSGVQHRFTKEDLKHILETAGSMLAAPVELGDVRHSFAQTSAVGRTWKRDIAGQRLHSDVVSKLLGAVNAKRRSILLTGKPGSGKTCSMLALQEALEEQALTRNIVPLFIQTREFAELATSLDRQAQGLSDQWVEKAARMSEHSHVVVVMDSLDVLSISRDHRVLRYFLSQIDQLLINANITVVTACRDFDRHYDRRIAERSWDYELAIQPLNWEKEVCPLLSSLGIPIDGIDKSTQELIRNPREFGLFVELAQVGGAFNVVTSQALAQRYLETIVRENDALGDEALKAIEIIATEMLRTRSLVVPHQHFQASQEIRRVLCSLNVLQETHDNKLTFGHQTLLDVLVISRAIRESVTLSQFIQTLPAVPFVRPSIRSFVSQLVLGERRDFRKQVRSVLNGESAFHIRRLVAETFAEQLPQDDDWPMLRDLHENNTGIFNVIYGAANAIEWHYFWLKHLIPKFLAEQNVYGLVAHVHRISVWSNDDIAGVVSYWKMLMDLDWYEIKFPDRVSSYLCDVNTENIAVALPLINRLLEIPPDHYNFLGRVIAKSVIAGSADDALLWKFILNNVSDEEMLNNRYGNKLRCRPHEFGSPEDMFLSRRMLASTTLLNLALDSVEKWSLFETQTYRQTRNGYHSGFLRETSYESLHSQGVIRSAESLEVLFGAIEVAILTHASNHSDWWKFNRDRVCLNHEGALIYFGIIACTKNPENNIEIIGRMLCDRNLLEFQLKYELGNLIQSAFQFLTPAKQDSVMECIHKVWEEQGFENVNRPWVLRNRAEYFASIPTFLRSQSGQKFLDSYQNEHGILVREPEILLRAGGSSSQLSYNTFLTLSDIGVLRVLKHFEINPERDDIYFLMSGQRDVAGQLFQAANRHPSRFLKLLNSDWFEIAGVFKDHIMDGVSTYLSYRFGNLRSQDPWQAVEDPDENVLANQILNELELHPEYWELNPATAKVIAACANFVLDKKHAEKLVNLSKAFANFQQDDPYKGEVDLITRGCALVKGDLAQAMIAFAINFRDNNNPYPSGLISTLEALASDSESSVRVLILRQLPKLQSLDSELGWRLFELVMRQPQELWEFSEPCFYHSYYHHFDIIEPILPRLLTSENGKALEIWGRISALAALISNVDFDVFLFELRILNNTSAWRGAATVWTNVENIKQHRVQCLKGLTAGFDTGISHAHVVANQLENLFSGKSNDNFIPLELVTECFKVVRQNPEIKDSYLYELPEWLNAWSQRDPEYALAVTELYFYFVINGEINLYDHENHFAQMMTRLFAEAEEREESDDGDMLRRVIEIQDRSLTIGVSGLNEWLKAAERP